MVVEDRHATTLATSSALTKYQEPSAIPPQETIETLNRNKISFVLAGVYGLAGWRNQARATERVEVIVASKQVKKAASTLVKRFPRLEVVDVPQLLRLSDKKTKDTAIWLIKPVLQPFREVFKHSHIVTTSKGTHRIPSLEMAIVMVFSAMTSLYRAAADMYMDAHGFIVMVKQNPNVDKEKLAKIGSLLYPHGGRYALEYVRRVQAGERLVL